VDSITGELRPEVVAVELLEPQFRLHPVSATFHGRDIFAPAGAHIADGSGLEEFGPRLDRLIPLPAPQPSVVGNTVRGRIIAVDHFGNAISNIPVDLLPPEPTITVKGAMVRGLSRTYQDAETVALIGSSGLLEVGVRNGSAAARFGIQRGDEIVVRGER
jgi:S-adenosylmethionine hydrolase